MIKRGFDVLVAVAALVVTAPLMLVIAVLIRLEDRGPALLRQSRVGLRRARTSSSSSSARWSPTRMRSAPAG